MFSSSIADGLYLNKMERNYSFVFTRPGKKMITKEFVSRGLANKEMYHLIGKYNLKIKSVYEDHHDITYNCLDGSKFIIDREL